MSEQENIMPDAAGQSPSEPHHDRQLYQLPLKEVQLRFTEAGIPRSDKSMRRYCQDGRLDCMKTEGPTGPQYFARASSVDRLIGELLQVQAIADMAGHSPA
jgi:hypothetical protein